MNLLMLSSSGYLDTPYLSHAQQMIDEHLGDITEVLFIPYAGVSLNWDAYTAKVQQALPRLSITGIHTQTDAKQTIKEAKAIAVGGGNTFHLLNELYKNQLLEPIREAVQQGTPYIGWSAGANICGNSIRTTNDMPIIQPPSFVALDLLPFQLNPHYSDYQAPGHNGETRAERLGEFMCLNPAMPIVGIREGAALLRHAQSLKLIGHTDGVLFSGGKSQPIANGQDLSELLH